MVLKAEIDSNTFLYVSPISLETYQEHMEIDSLGGRGGYFVLRARRHGRNETLDVLAKAASFDAAGEIFDMIVSSQRRHLAGSAL